jgi:hypothetical protein
MDLFKDGGVGSHLREYTMTRLIYKRVGGHVAHVSDCQIWAEIFYLDSPTNYREFLPQKHRTQSTPSDESLVMIDELPTRPNIRSLFRLPAIPILFLVGFILYFAFKV